ncbi:hypothetical protein Tco_1576689 [Tanacetum coccineum]
MSRIKSWDEIVDKMVDRLSKWKMKTLSIGGRLTLLKAVIGSMPIYHMSIFKSIHGEDGKNGSGFKLVTSPFWRSKSPGVGKLKIKGYNTINNFKQKKLGNGADTNFGGGFEGMETWFLKQRYPRHYERWKEED